MFRDFTIHYDVKYRSSHVIFQICKHGFSTVSSFSLIQAVNSMGAVQQGQYGLPGVFNNF